MAFTHFPQTCLGYMFITSSRKQNGYQQRYPSQGEWEMQTRVERPLADLATPDFAESTLINPGHLLQGPGCFGFPTFGPILSSPAAPDPQPVNVVSSSKPAKEHKDSSPTTGHTTIDSDSQENNNNEVASEEEKKSESHDLTYIAQDLTKASELSEDEAEVPSSTIAPVGRETTPLAPGITQVVAKTAKHKQAEPKR
jgi:hypothetical protein